MSATAPDLAELERAYRGRSVFVTGHTGFKGAWLTLWLHRLGARVSGYALAPPTDPSLFAAARVEELLSAHHEADLRETERLERAVADAAPDVVFHLAAQALVRPSYAAPRETFAVNVVGTAALLDAVRALGRPCPVVAVTSDKCYENREQVWGYREDDPFGGHDPYSASKGAAEVLVASYRRSFGMRLASARAGNVIGGGDWAADRIVCDLARAVAAGEPLEVRSPRAVRPWQHVLEPLSGYLLLGARLLESDDPRWASGWNFGPLPGDELTVRELVERFLAAWGEGSWRDASDPKQPHEAKVLRLCVDKALWELGWRPRWSADEAIRRTVEWYRAFHAGEGDPRALALAQIDAYLAAR
ncbi:MAG: CDP-glucose 4,6-dehydratase [Planctomycetota bacterium]|nr:MAG: CDP-glucose 4,6-dehydratase [Planctomycetota bacterium]